MDGAERLREDGLTCEQIAAELGVSRVRVQQLERQALRKARRWCEDPACGIAGPNQDARFGRWVSTNFADTQSSTLLNARRLWEVFGQRQDEVAFIPQSGLYALAEPKCDETREDQKQPKKPGI